jgi:uncharacterized protein with HEPN domain
MRDYRLYLADIIDAFEAIEDFIGEMSIDEFVKDDKTVSAVIRKLEIVGEASKMIPQEIRDRYSDIPWGEMARMRDKLIHFYFGIDHKLLWQTAKKRIPAILPILRRIKA